MRRRLRVRARHASSRLIRVITCIGRNNGITTPTMLSSHGTSQHGYVCKHTKKHCKHSKNLHGQVSPAPALVHSLPGQGGIEPAGQPHAETSLAPKKVVSNPLGQARHSPDTHAKDVSVLRRGITLTSCRLKRFKQRSQKRASGITSASLVAGGRAWAQQTRS